MSEPIIVRSKYPRGEQGALLSVELTARAAAEGRMSPKVRSWAQRKVVEAGSPRDDMGRAKAIHDAVRREKPYFADPVEAEMIPAAECTVADCDGLSFDGGDCDDLTVALVSSLESIGIRCAVVGHQYDHNTIEHVLAAVWVGGRYHYADPATNLPFGQARKPRRERMLDVPAMTVLCDAVPRCDDTIRPDAGALTHGDFVGVGKAEGVVEDTSQANLSNQFAAAYQALNRAWDESALAYNRMAQYRKLSGKPLVDDYIYASTGQAWTPEDERNIRNLATITAVSRQYTLDGADGARPVGAVGDIVYVLAPTTEPSVQAQNGSVILVNAPGTGATEIVPANFVGVGFPVLAVAITIGAVIAVIAICDASKTHIARVQSKDRMDHQRYLIEKGIPPAEVVALEQSLADQAEREALARTKVEEQSGLNAVAKTVQVATYGALGLGAAYAVVQAVIALRARQSASRQPAWGY